MRADAVLRISRNCRPIHSALEGSQKQDPKFRPVFFRAQFVIANADRVPVAAKLQDKGDCETRNNVSVTDQKSDQPSKAKHPRRLMPQPQLVSMVRA